MLRDEIVSYCRSVIGCSYSTIPSGGTEYESYNCSFLTYCAYRAAGLEIPTWQGHQNGDGSQSDWVRDAGNWKWTADELEPADLVFFGSSPYDTYHVGIYVGDGMIIDSIPDGGVQERFLYETFVGGGWPFKIEPEKKEEEMPKFLNVEGVLVYFDGHDVHDVSEIESVPIIQKTFADIPVVDYSVDDFARLMQVLRAGIPPALKEAADRYPPRAYQ